MKNCSECKHKDWPNGCLLGHNQSWNDWWKSNGKKIRGRDIFDELECHEYSDGAKMLISMNEKASELLAMLKEENSNKLDNKKNYE